jgi:hypothetical protein
MSLTETPTSPASSPGGSLIGNRKFFPHPNQITIAVGEGENKRLESIPIIQHVQTPVQVQDVGDDKYLQTSVTDFFYEKVLKWVKSYPDFSHLKKHYNFLKGPNGKPYIYNLLRLFVKKSAANWFDLRDNNNYVIIKDFLKYKIGNI